MLILWILLSLLVLIIILSIYYYNRFVVLSNRIDNSLSQINVQLKRRADLVPNLIKTVKGYAKHEKEVLDAVNDARKALVSANNIEKKVKANDRLEDALKSIFAIAENYPELKANENFLELQKELSSTEDRIAYSRQFYNDSILVYNNIVTTMPGAIFAKIFNRSQKQYLEIAESEKRKIDVNFE